MRAVAGEAFNWPINMVNQKLTWLGKGERRARKSGSRASGGGAGHIVMVENLFVAYFFRTFVRELGKAAGILQLKLSK